MTATDELRRLLDERGVEHYDGTERTLWGYEQTGEDTGIYRFAASEISGGFLQFDMFRITPEQAIAATLGSFNYTNDERTNWTCHRLPADNYGTTCIVRGHGYEMEFGYWKCSKCGTNCFEGARYCMSCGAKVVDA